VRGKSRCFLLGNASLLQGTGLSLETACVPLSRVERTGHLPKLILDFVVRLRLDSGLPALTSMAARNHEAMRFQQGYTATMLVEEARILQVSIVGTLQENLGGLDFSRLLLVSRRIADEIDSQLRQAISSYVTPTSLKSSDFSLLAFLGRRKIKIPLKTVWRYCEPVHRMPCPDVVTHMVVVLLRVVAIGSTIVRSGRDLPRGAFYGGRQNKES
jgi:hypothetical protein